MTTLATIEAAAQAVEKYGDDAHSASRIRTLIDRDDMTLAETVATAYTAAAETAEKNLQAAFTHGVHFIQDLRIPHLDKFVWKTYSGEHDKGVAATNAELERRIGHEVCAAVLRAYH